MAVRSPASISSCVSKRVKAPEPAAAGLPDYAHRVVLAGHPAVALRAAAGRFRQAADGSCLVRGFCSEPPDRLPREAGQNQVLRHLRHPQRSGAEADPACRLVLRHRTRLQSRAGERRHAYDSRSFCGAQLASEAAGSWFRWPASAGCPGQAASSQAQTRSGGPGTAVAVAAALVPGAGQQLAGLPGDRAADLPHQGPDPRDLGAEPVIVFA